MDVNIAKKVAYDLTLEYVRQNNIMKVSMDFKIPRAIEHIEKKYKEIYEALKDKDIL